jgi:hypothetical protein
VRSVVADQAERAVALGGQDRNRSAVVHRQRQVAQLAVDLDRQRRTRQPGADRGRDVGAAGPIGELERLSVGQCHVRAHRRSDPTSSGSGDRLGVCAGVG